MHDELSTFLDRESRSSRCRLDRKDRYRGPVATKADLRETFGLRADDPLPDMSMFPDQEARRTEQVRHPGGAVTSMRTRSHSHRAPLAAMAERVPAPDFDVRRFRPTTF